MTTSLGHPNFIAMAGFFVFVALSLVITYVAARHTRSAEQFYAAGRRITGLGTHRIAERGIARAFQIARPFRELSVADNVRVGALFGALGPRDVPAVIARALDLASLARLADRPASALTVGQLRHLEIARAIATRPGLLLADEPCAGLNPTETAAMIALLRTVRDQGTTVLLVEHDMPSVMEVSDRIVVLDAGRKIAEVVPAQVRVDPAVIAAYLGTAE